MEILVELLIQLLGGALELAAQLLMQVVAEVFVEFVLRSIGEPFRRPEPIHPAFAAIGYALLGGIAGVVSLWLLPTLLITAKWLRVTNLFVTPFCAGMLMALLGWWRRRRNQEVIRLDTFSYGFCFALAMAIVRFAWGHLPAG